MLETGLVVVYGLGLGFMPGFSLPQWQLTRLAHPQAFGLNAHFLVEQAGRQAGGHSLKF